VIVLSHRPSAPGPDLDSSPIDFSIVIVDNVVRTNSGLRARLEELAAW
jgi:hypothetical protein